MPESDLRSGLRPNDGQKPKWLPQHKSCKRVKFNTGNLLKMRVNTIESLFHLPWFRQYSWKRENGETEKWKGVETQTPVAQNATVLEAGVLPAVAFRFNPTFNCKQAT